ncbi:MAG TPA: pyruvate kinase alpha/beta domain-containing protein [Bacillota bacterium]|nr:pyruvate kinase alpha/beta domain-containing protein [Bacillota bacterium]
MGPAEQRALTTSATARLAAKAAMEEGIRHIVIASNTGATALALLEALKAEFPGGGGPKVVCVTHMVGFSEDGADEMSADMRKRLADEGVSVLTTTHLFGGVERSMSNQWKGIYPLSMVANSLKLFGQGTKVAVEIAVMALDSGLIPFGHDVISIGGTGRGADTALMIRPAHSLKFFDTSIVRVITMPERRS